MFEVSIIMPVYNVSAHLPRAIQSVLNQTKMDFELILVNDGSTDDSGLICDQFVEEEPLLIQVIHQKNQGSGMARNAGLRRAKGKYIYFADPDDYFKPTLLAENVRLAEEKQADLVVFGYTREVEGKPEDRVTLLPRQPHFYTQDGFKKHFRNFHHFSPYSLWNKLYCRQYLREHKIRFTNQKLGQDALFNISVYRDIQNVAFNRKAYYHYVTHDGSAVNRYRDDRFMMELNIALQFKNLIEHWGMETEFNDLLKREFWHPVYLELANIAHPDCPMTTEEKVEWIKTICEEENINRFVIQQDRKESNPFQYVLQQRVQKGKYLMAIQLMEKRNASANNYGKLFNKMKRFFTS
ncbi:putative glycosyl transferase [Marinilactibacillus psychrotolerans]|uniref:glycosyltransferase family 2 protein n=1 Tax=Marinilactibacillus psychrotolerans TaxID=191770 RepID=UPI001C7CDFCF|nr:glycosyltransferase [Marinilactibacillus psychrotolerans]GEQ32299.1 putative glycosyl transferase [Marinilactibacillus psychrotolerans]